MTSSSVVAVHAVCGTAEPCVKGGFDSVWLLHILLLRVFISLFVYVSSLLVCACEKLGCKMGKKGCSRAAQSFALWSQCTAGWQ